MDLNKFLIYVQEFNHTAMMFKPHFILRTPVQADRKIYPKLGTPQPQKKTFKLGLQLYKHEHDQLLKANTDAVRCRSVTSFRFQKAQTQRPNSVYLTNSMRKLLEQEDHVSNCSPSVSIVDVYLPIIQNTEDLMRMSAHKKLYVMRAPQPKRAKFQFVGLKLSDFYTKNVLGPFVQKVGRMLSEYDRVNGTGLATEAQKLEVDQ